MCEIGYKRWRRHATELLEAIRNRNFRQLDLLLEAKCGVLAVDPVLQTCTTCTAEFGGWLRRCDRLIDQAVRGF